MRCIPYATSRNYVSSVQPAEPTTEIYPLSLHDALPISTGGAGAGAGRSVQAPAPRGGRPWRRDRKSTRLNSSHTVMSYAVFCLKKKKVTIPACRNGGRTRSELLESVRIYQLGGASDR